jgi:putative endonuclease
MREFYVYILASKRNGILYTGVTNNLVRRIDEHKNGRISGFTKKHHIQRLVYCENTPSIEDAIRREKEIKGWKRTKKIALIEQENPLWQEISLS